MGVERIVSRLRRFLGNRGDRINSVRRHILKLGDQAYALTRRRLFPPPPAPPFDGKARFALLTVNFSTTRLLKLMLLTLAEQERLALLHRIIVVDNDSRDGGLAFLRRLAAEVPRAHLVEQRYFPHHARGLRTGVRALAAVEQGLSLDEQTNVLLVCDADVVYRDTSTLETLAAVFEDGEAVFAGELRHGVFRYPEAQASFFAVRRDVVTRRDIAPFVHHGAPAYFLQRSLWRANLRLADFPSNAGGYVLHRGRVGVAAARTYRRQDPVATAGHGEPHFMGVPGGKRIWDEIEARYGELLEPKAETELLARLRAGLVLGASAAAKAGESAGRSSAEL